MNPLLKKEIRLVLPAWLAIVVLGLGLPWFGKDQDTAIMTAPVFFFLGMVLLAVDSFGREFSLGTFSSLMAQPLERQQVWRTKISVLLVAAALVFVVFFLGCELRLHRQFSSLSLWHTFGFTMTQSGVVLLVALAGGLWAALLIRQTAAAFWIALLAPAGLLMLAIFATSFLFKSASNWSDDAILYVAAGLYIPAAFWFAHRLFFRAEDAGWTGGVISFSKWRYFEGAKQAVESQRKHRPIVALLKKEFQLHSISLFGAGVLLGLQGLVFFLRANYSDFHKDSLAATITDCFWFLWLVIPLVTGCMAVAEERKLAVTDGQRCLPVAPWLQYLLKLFPVMFLGVLLGGIMPLLLEGLAASRGEPSVFFKDESHTPLDSIFLAAQYSGVIWFQMGILALSAGLAWAGFFASTLAKNFLQALSIAILIVVGGFFFYALFGWLEEQHVSFFGLMPMPWLLIFLIAIPTLAGTFLWLGFRNFIAWQESGRLWGRNAAGFLGAALFVLVSSGLIYDRVWEVFKPAELPHGAATLSLAKPPQLHGGNNFVNDLQVSLSDGRVWCGSLESSYWGAPDRPWKQLWILLVNPTPISVGPQAFIEGAGWISTSAGHVHFRMPNKNIEGDLDTVGIRTNGTLWISSESKPGVWTGAQMTQFGSETNWRQVIRNYSDFLLLKSDGTLWQWGTNNSDRNLWQAHWATVRNFQPKQIGTNSDWQEIFFVRGDYARKKDGSIWQCERDGDNSNLKFVRQGDLASVDPKTYSGLAYVGPDGSLWISRHFNETGQGWEGTEFLRVGREAGWLAVATSPNRMVALRNDGTLWQWNLSSAKSAEEAAANLPRRLGIHNDWVALHSAMWGAVSLAADGSLWLWPDLDSGQPTLMKLPKQPKLLGNVLAAN